MSNGKGDKRRPTLISSEELDKNWNRTFKKKSLCDFCVNRVCEFDKDLCCYTDEERAAYEKDHA